MIEYDDKPLLWEHSIAIVFIIGAIVGLCYY